MQNVKETAAIAGTATASPDDAIATAPIDAIATTSTLQSSKTKCGDIGHLARVGEQGEKWRIVNESRPNNEKMEKNGGASEK